MRKPQLLAPGGSFLAAYHAFEAGADGVYLGLREFSARKAAQNFSLEQLRRIRKLAEDRDRRVYVTVNTVIRQEELTRLAETLAWLQELSVDGVIVQDLGVCRLIARGFPRLAVHASTQMAVHNEAGLRVARDLGIRRVILSRELPLERIRALRESVPDMELEVFIHGALCYSFSGICLASWALTGRSGNRGDCAQICRSLFQVEPGSAGGGAAADLAIPGFYFSCRDLFLGREVLALAEAGVDSLKIEGRMKSPEYVANVTRLYRRILDLGEKLDDGEYAELLRKAQLGFARRQTTGWLRASAGARLVETRFPGHVGAPLGTVGSVKGREVTITLLGDLSLHDGVGYFAPGIDEMVAFSVSRIRREGREARFARAGETVSVEVPREVSAPLPAAGQELRHLSSRFLDLPQPREPGFPPYKAAITLDVSLERAAGGPKGGALRVRVPGFPGFERVVTVDAASVKRPFIQILTDVLAESGDSLFRPDLVTFTNATGLADDGIFVPPSQLKKAKNDLYAFLDGAFASRAADAAAVGEGSLPLATAPVPLGPADLAALADRGLISPRRQAPIPFVGGDPGALALSDLQRRAGCRWLPLPPVMFDSQSWIDALKRLADEAAGAPLAIGLNNVSHLAIAEALADRGNAWFFVDYLLYAANIDMLRLVLSRVPRLLFAYSWIEGDEAGHDALAAAAAGIGIPVVRVSADFRPPLFTSMGCFARHVLNGGACFDDCPKDFTRELRQGRNRFRLVVRDCVTYLFESKE